MRIFEGGFPLVLLDIGIGTGMKKRKKKYILRDVN